jgi:hypothetical protein
MPVHETRLHKRGGVGQGLGRVEAASPLHHALCAHAPSPSPSPSHSHRYKGGHCNGVGQTHVVDLHAVQLGRDGLLVHGVRNADLKGRWKTTAVQQLVVHSKMSMASRTCPGAPNSKGARKHYRGIRQHAHPTIGTAPASRGA